MTSEEVAIKLNDHDNEIGSLKHRMTKAENTIEEIRNLTTSVQLMAQKQEQTSEKIDKLSEKVDAIDSQPKEAWENAKKTIITVIITAITTGILTTILSHL